MNLIGNRYEIINYGEHFNYDMIYKARDIYNNQPIYIKVLRNTPYVREDFISKLISESEIIRNLNSNYILDILDIGFHYSETEVFFYLVSEYDEGTTLDKIIKTYDIHSDEIASIITQILKGLSDAQERNIYHGDLKPSNILLDKDYNVKILNFGLTKANKGINIRSNEDINYLSPHQLCINYTDTESDMFSLGLILFEMIFKKSPYPEIENNDDKERLRLLDKGIDINSLVYAEEYEYLIKIINKLLNRKDKFKNLKDIILDLSLVLYKDVDKSQNKYIDELKVCKKKITILKKGKELLVIGTAIVILVVITKTYIMIK